MDLPIQINGRAGKHRVLVAGDHPTFLINVDGVDQLIAERPILQRDGGSIWIRLVDGQTVNKNNRLGSAKRGTWYYNGQEIVPQNDCPFCDYQGPNSILVSMSSSYIIEPLDPVVEGHRLVIPNVHVESFPEDPDITGRVAAEAAMYARRKGEQFNLITSAGEHATQTVRHLHFHLVPRREGDGLRLPWN